MSIGILEEHFLGWPKAGLWEGRREAALRDSDFLPPSAEGLAPSAYFQDGGGLGARMPDLPGAASGTYGSRQGWERRVPVKHFPPEVTWCPTGVYKEGGAPQAQGSEAFALCGAGPWQATSKGWQNHCLLRSSEAGPRLGGCWEMRGLKRGGTVVSGG